MLEKILVAVVAGLFGLIPAVLQWIAERAKRRGKSHVLSELKDELDFLEKWGKAIRDLGVSPTATENAAGSSMPSLLASEIEKDMRRVLQRYRQIGAFKQVVDNREILELPWFRKMLLLFKPRSTLGSIYHTAFYFLIFFFIAILISDYSAPTFDPKTGENEFKYLVIGLTVILGLPILLLQRAAVNNRNQNLKTMAALREDNAL